MNEFNQQLLAEKRKHQRLYLAIVALFLVGVLFVLTLLLVSRGTRIEIKPNDASLIASINVDKGWAIIKGDTLYSISNQPIIRLVSDGFYTKKYTVSDKDFGHVLTIVMQPLPAKVMLNTTLNGEQITWLVDGKVHSRANNFDHELAAGEHTITASHPYYQKTEIALSLTRGQEFSQQIEFDQLVGSVNINSKPKGAIVLLNDVAMGQTPVNLTLQGGEHHIAIQHQDHETINDIISVTQTQLDLQRNYKMAVKKAGITLSLSPGGGKLRVNGLAVKTEKMIRIDADKNHIITYSKQGYFSERKTIKLLAGKSAKLEFNLKKEMGKVEVFSLPRATILVNGKRVGETPLSLSLQALQQIITLKKPGFRTVEKVVLPTSASIKKINVTLLNEKSARLKESPNTYINKAGSTLKLFKPNDSFTIGASRSEAGQRANEIIKKVQLKRPFYASIYEVTNKQYRYCNKAKQGDNDKPVTNISWLNAAEYCNCLSEKEGLTAVYTIRNGQLQAINLQSDGYRLLTEAEWEWLARKAGKTKQTLFVWGDERVMPKNVANIADESANGTVKVYVSSYNDGYAGIANAGSFQQEKSGLYDQAGNVSEWVHDSYSIAPVTGGKVFYDPFNGTVSNTHVVKGANWRSGSLTQLRASFREGLYAPADDLGFRIGRYVSP